MLNQFNDFVRIGEKPFLEIIVIAKPLLGGCGNPMIKGGILDELFADVMIC